MHTILDMYVCIIQGDQMAEKLVQEQASSSFTHIWSISILVEPYIMVII